MFTLSLKRLRRFVDFVLKKEGGDVLFVVCPDDMGGLKG